MKNRDTFNFYRSFFEAGKDLSDEDRLSFYDAILYNSFENKNIKLKGIAKTLFTAVRPVVDSQTQNYLNGKKGGRPKKNNPPLVEENNPPLSKKESYKEKEKEKEKYIKVFSFTLKTQMYISNTNEEYKTKLEEYIVGTNKKLSYSDFYNQCEMKPYKYKNFKLAYDKWTKDEQSNDTRKRKGGVQC